MTMVSRGRPESARSAIDAVRCEALAELRAAERCECASIAHERACLLHDRAALHATRDAIERLRAASLYPQR